MFDREVRALTLTAGEFRIAGEEGRTLQGYAAVFNKATSLGQFDEVIEPGAFSRSL